MTESTEMSADAKGLRLAIRAYLVTLAVTVLITLLTILILVDTQSCSSVSRGLAVQGVATAVVFLVSIVVVGVRLGKAVPSVVARLALVAAYGVVMLASYGVITCGLMVAFNC